MRLPCCLPLGRFAAVCVLLGLGVRLGLAEVKTYHIGRGGLSWASQADIQNGTVGVAGGLQPLELRRGQNLMELLRAAGQAWLNGSPSDFTKPGQPRTWSNDGPFNQVNGPLRLVDGDPASSSEAAFRTARNQAGATFFWDLGAPFPIERVRFAPAPDNLDWFIKAFELRVSDGEQFDEVKRPVYRLLSRVEDNKDPVVELSFNGVQGRFLRLKVLSRNPFNLAEFEVYGEGFVPVSSYVSQLYSFGRPVNFGRLVVRAERLSRGPAIMRLQLRSGMDDTPIAYFRRDRDTGVREEVSRSEYNNLPRRALYRRDPTTGAVLGEVTRTEYLSLPLAEVGPARDFVPADIREDVENWSSWTPPLQLDSSATVAMPLGLPSPREFLQFRVFFNGHAASTMRLDSLVVEFSPELVSEAVGEVALAADPSPASGILAVPSGVDTSFVCDILTQFDEGDLAGFRGLALTAFPPPVFERLQMGDPLVEVADVAVEPIAEGFRVFFPPVTRQNNQPMRLTFKLRVLEYHTPLNAFLLGDSDVPPHPIVPGNASAEVGTEAIHIFAASATPSVAAHLSTSVLTPNGDGVNDEVEVAAVLTQFAGTVPLAIEIFDLSGHRVRALIAAPRAAGVYRATWDGRDRTGTRVAPGLYLCRIGVSTSTTATQLIGVAY